MGRPTKLNEQTHEAIVLSVRKGNYVETAAEAVGITATTFYRWMERGEADVENDVKSVFSEFCEAIKRAKAESEAIDLDHIADAAGKGNWQAAAWRLERRFPTKWGKQDKLQLEHSGKIGQDAAEMTDAELDALIAGFNGDGN
jgi:hypothetical protein